jgi:hypothetical protein
VEAALGAAWGGGMSGIVVGGGGSVLDDRDTFVSATFYVNTIDTRYGRADVCGGSSMSTADGHAPKEQPPALSPVREEEQLSPGLEPSPRRGRSVFWSISPRPTETVVLATPL